MIDHVSVGDLPGAMARLEGTRTVALRIPGAVSDEDATRWVRGVYEAKADWTSDFDGAQFCLGRAWYTHLEEGRADEYFKERSASDALVERHCPGLQATLRGLASTLLGANVVPRESYCGPGVHVFPARGHAATKGGDIHFDTEGLTPAQRDARSPAYTLVLMLEPAEQGGGLEIWDARFEGSDVVGDAMTSRESAVITYGARELVVFSSYQLHQIQPFEGDQDRISATCHVARARGRWEAWF